MHVAHVGYRCIQRNDLSSKDLGLQGCQKEQTRLRIGVALRKFGCSQSSSFRPVIWVSIKLLSATYTTAKLDLDQVAALPLVTTTCMEPIIYVHAGQPRAVDGPNPLAVDRKLVYVGKAAS